MAVFPPKGNESAYDSLNATAPVSSSRGRAIVRRWIAPIGALVILFVFIRASLAPSDKQLDALSLGSWSPFNNEAVRAGAGAPSKEVQAGRWGQQLHEISQADCKAYATEEAVPYEATIRTGFVSYPRSGNSYMRSLIERTTGYQTSSVYCDTSLLSTFKGECSHELGFFEKTHYPALGPRGADVGLTAENYWMRYDQAVHLVRNPFDASVSWFNLGRSYKKGKLDHEYKVDGQRFGQKERKEMLDLAKAWVLHTNYWDNHAPLQKLTMRYEDLRAQPVPHMMSLLSFLLPEAHLPNLDRLACMVEKDGSHEAYKSERRSNFASWELWTPELRRELLQVTREPFCRHGYARLMREALGEVDELDGLCAESDFGREHRTAHH